MIVNIGIEVEFILFFVLVWMFFTLLWDFLQIFKD
jgi:hypothetical protein